MSGTQVVWNGYTMATKGLALPLAGETLNWSLTDLTAFDLTMYGGPGEVVLSGPSSLTDDSQLTLSASNSTLINDGAMSLNDSMLTVGSLAGDGTIHAIDGSTIIVDVGSVPSSETITLDSTSTLILLDPSDPPAVAPTPDVATITAQTLGIGVSNPDIGEAYRLYQAALDRAPDQGGLTYWTSQLLNGLPPITLAQDFANSAEFLQDYGHMTAADFVNTMYENVLHRAPDPAGDAFWIGSMNAGLSQASTLLSFSDCTENRMNTNVATHES